MFTGTGETFYNRVVHNKDMKWIGYGITATKSVNVSKQEYSFWKYIS